jgi:hypothetical protein
VSDAEIIGYMAVVWFALIIGILIGGADIKGKK